MNYLTYFEASRPWWFCVVIATGPGTTPTPDGGPWAVQYTVTTDELEDRARLATVSANAEELLRRMLRDHAPAVLRDAVALGWFAETPSGGAGT